MTEELNTQVEAGAVTETGGESTSGEAMTEASQEAPNLQTQIDAAVQAAINEYEKADGHLAKLRRKKDLEIASLQKQLEQQRKGKLDRAKQLMGQDPAKAAQILAEMVEAQDHQLTAETKQRELVGWQHKILADLGADPAEDEEAAALVEEWSPRLMENPNHTWDFQQKAAQLQLERERKVAKEATTELQTLKDNLPDLIKAEITRALVAGGVVPEASEGGTPTQRQEDWRNLSPSQLISMGLKERERDPVVRN